MLTTVQKYHAQKRNMRKIWGMKEMFIILIVVMLLQV